MKYGITPNCDRNWEDPYCWNWPGCCGVARVDGKLVWYCETGVKLLGVEAHGIADLLTIGVWKLGTKSRMVHIWD